MKMMRLRLARTAVAFVCGAMALAAEANAWVVGQVAPMSGAGATQGRAYAQGMRLYFDQINKAGGVQGQPVQLVTVDDVGHPDETVDKTRKLLDESKPVVLPATSATATWLRCWTASCSTSPRSPWWVTRARTRGC